MMAAIVGVLGTGLLAVIGWVFTMSNRVAVLEADKVSLKELINVRLEDITRRLGRIEEKLEENGNRS